MKSKIKSWFLQKKYYFLILAIVLIFFNPVFFGKIPFPGDLLASENPYKETSYLGFPPGGIPNKAQGPDVIKQIYPWRFFSIESLKKGQIPFWNPYNFSGNPQMANFQTGIFYPLNIFYFFLPFNVSWTLLIMLQPLLAGIFMYLFLVKGLRLSNFSGFLGGIAFAFSSYMTVWIEYGNIGHTLLWLPLVLLFVKRIYEKTTAFNFFVIIFSLALSLLAGYIQGLFYIYILSFAYFIYLGRLKDVGKFFLFLLSLVLPLFLTAFQLFPTLEIFNISARSDYSLEQISNLLLPIQHWVTLFAADFFGNPATRNYYFQGTYIERIMYVGVPILFFIFYSLKSKFKEIKFFAIFAALSLIIASNLLFIKFFYLLPIPVVSTTVPTRELSIFIFCMIVLSGIGISFWEKSKSKTKIPYLFIGLYLALWILVFAIYKFNLITPENFRVTARNLVLPNLLAFLTIMSFYLRNNLGKIFLFGIVLFDLLYFFNKITPFSSTALVYPKTPIISYLQDNAGINRFWGYGSAYIPPNFQTVDKTYSPEGYDPLYISSYGKLLASSSNGEVPEILPRPDANLAPGYGLTDMRSNFYRQRLLNLLGVRYVLNKNDGESSFPSEIYELIFENGVWQIYENKTSIPRFFMTNDYRVFGDKNEVLKNIYNKNINLDKTILLEEKPSLEIDKNSQNSIKLLSYSSNNTEFQTKSSGNSLVFLSDNYYPGWQVYVDGKPKKILVADYSFRAVSVPKGEHKLEFIYKSESFISGLKFSIFGLLLIIIFIIWLRKHEEK